MLPRVKSKILPDFNEIANVQEKDGEAELLRNIKDVIEGLLASPDDDRERMLECLDIIVEGQLLRFRKIWNR